MNHLEQLQKAVAGSADHQARLQAVKSEEEAISTLLEIAGAENIALERADLERQIEAAEEKAGELSDGALDAVSGGSRRDPLRHGYVSGDSDIMKFIEREIEQWRQRHP